MTKLKTLKDIGANDGIVWALKSVIKQEAIKWVKYMDKVKKQESLDWKVIFRNFHNIAEEELAHKD